MNSHYMSKASLPSVLLRLWILLHVATMVCTMKGDKSCSEEGMGELCGDKCKQACIAKHPSGEGDCETIGGIPLCTCYYDCPPPRPPRKKFCHGGAGLCSAEKCWDDCCSKNCAAKYMNGTGFCSDMGLTILCQCEYPCN